MTVSKELLIINKRGLHARASAKFVQTVDGYDAEVTVSKDGMTVGGTCSSSSSTAARHWMRWSPIGSARKCKPSDDIRI